MYSCEKQKIRGSIEARADMRNGFTQKNNERYIGMKTSHFFLSSLFYMPLFCEKE